MEGFVRVVRFLSSLCGIVAAALIALAVVVVCQMVFIRYALNQNTIWQTDFVTYSLIAATFVGSSYVLMLRGHVNVDVLPHYLKSRKRYWLAVFTSLLSLVFAVTVTVLTAQFWKEAWDQQWVSDTMWRARLWIPYASMPIGLGLLSLQCLADLWRLVAQPGRAVRHQERAHLVSPTTQGAIVLVVTLAVLLSGAPVAFGLGAISLAFLVIFQGFDALKVVAETLYGGLHDFTLVSIPMFVMMGAAIGSSPAGKDLYEALDRWLYRLPGGLVISNLGACALFAALTGSSPACCAAIGKMGIPGDAQARLSRRHRHRLHLRRRHARHPHSAVDHLHPVRHCHRDVHRPAVPGGRAAWSVAHGAVHPLDAVPHLEARVPLARHRLPLHMEGEIPGDPQGCTVPRHHRRRDVRALRGRCHALGGGRRRRRAVRGAGGRHLSHVAAGRSGGPSCATPRANR